MRVAQVLDSKWETFSGLRPSLVERLSFLVGIPAFMAFVLAFYGIEVPADYPFAAALIVKWVPLQMTWLGYELCTGIMLCGFASIGRRPLWTALVFGGLVGAVAMQPMRGWFYGFWYGTVMPGDPGAAFPPFDTFAAALAHHLGYTVVPVATWLAANALFLVIARAAAQRTPQLRATAATATPAPSAHLWPDFVRSAISKCGDDILAIQSEDHYVRVIFPQGSELLRYRFKDAISALEPLGFRQIHRGTCVRLSAVTDINPDVHATSVCLKTGTVLPVSRSFRIPLLDAWRNAATQAQR